MGGNLRIFRGALATFLSASIGVFTLVAPVAVAADSPGSSISAPKPSFSTKLPTNLEPRDVSGFLLDTSGFSPGFSDLSFSNGSRFFGDRLSWGRGLLGQYRSIELAVGVSADEAIQMANELSSKFGTNVIPQVTFRKSVESDIKPLVDASNVQTGATWGLDRVDQRALPLDSRYEYHNDGSGVTVYVVDTGILMSHNEFAGRISTGYSSILDGAGPTDCDGHGTHVAGTIGGTTYGVAKDVTLVPVRVLDCDGSGTDATVISGIEWVISNHSSGPAVMNLSLGGGYSAPLNEAVRLAHEAGIVVVVASGNAASDACFDSPASEPTAITVNASTSWDDDASFSNYGSCTDIYAPGQSIQSAFIGGNSQSATLNGTSMAAPHVAGAAALILEQNPDLTPAQVWIQMAANATEINWYYTAADAKILLFTGSDLARFVSPPTPLISGSPTTGETLTVEPGDWSTTCDCTPTFEYAWLRAGTPISGATEITYVLQEADNGRRISVRVTASADGYLAEELTSSQTAAVSSGFDVASTPTISGIASAGQTLRVATGTWSPRPRFRYQWNCDGAPISRATRTTLRLSSSQDDCLITVSVTGTARNVSTTTRVSEAVGPVGTQFLAAPTPTIFGNAGYENVLSVEPGSWAPTPNAMTFQWYYGDGSAIVGATSPSYLVTEADYGNSIALCATGQLAGYVETVRCSVQTDVVLGYALSLTPLPEIIGDVGIGNIVLVSVGTWDVGVTHLIQWLRNGSPIPGANDLEYGVSDADSGASLSVSVTGELEGYSAVTRLSEQYGPVANAFVRAPAPIISGSLREGSTLRAITGSWSPRPRFSYQWYRDGEPISRATRSSYRLSASDVGSRITVSVTATARGYTTVTRLSAESGLVASRR